MACGRLVEILSPALFEIAEFHQLVAHHVGMGGESLLHGAQRIGHHRVPVFLVKRHHLERQVILARYQSAHFNIFVGRAVALAVVVAYPYVEKMQVVTLLFQQVDHNGAVNSARHENRNLHILFLSFSLYTSSSSDSLLSSVWIIWSDRK